MGTTITKETTVDSSWANSEQPRVFPKDMLLSTTVTWQEDLDQEQTFAKVDFKRDSQKVSRRIKK